MLPAVGRSKDAALLVRAVRMPEHGDEQPVRVARVDDDLRDLLAVAQAEMRPGRAGVDRLVDAVAGGEVGPLQAFAAADVDDARIGRRDRDRADRAGGLVVEDRRPRAAGSRSSSRRRRSPRRRRRRWVATECRRRLSCGRPGRARCGATCSSRQERRVDASHRLGVRDRAGDGRGDGEHQRDARPSFATHRHRSAGSTSVCQRRGQTQKRRGSGGVTVRGLRLR